MIKRLSISVVLVILLAFVFASLAQATTTSNHTVAAGDTFFALARKYNTTVANLLKLNPYVNPDTLYVGQKLIVPAAATQVEKQQYYIYHQVQSGETLSGIATMYSVPPETIARANSLTSNPIKTGQIIRIPVGNPTKTYPYYVKAGDTYSSLARKFNTTVYALLENNYFVHPESLRVGALLQIPVKQVHTVKSGETLYRIAQQHKTTIGELMRLNELKNGSQLLVGQRLIISL